MASSVVAEQERLNKLLDRVEQVEKVIETFPEGDWRRALLAEVCDGALADGEPVRPVIAAELLQVSEKTVRAWAHEGVLTTVRTRPRLLLDPGRLHEVMHLLRDLRSAGRSRDLLNAVWNRLSDRALLDRDDLAESIQQMRAGEGKTIYRNENDGFIK